MANISKKYPKYITMQIDDQDLAGKIRVLSSITQKGYSTLAVEAFKLLVEKYEKTNPAFFKQLYEMFFADEEFIKSFHSHLK